MFQLVKCKEIKSRDDPPRFGAVVLRCPGSEPEFVHVSVDHLICAVWLCLLWRCLHHGQGLGDCARASFSATTTTQNRPSLVSHTTAIVESTLLFLLPGDSQKCVEKGSSMPFFTGPFFTPSPPICVPFDR